MNTYKINPILIFLLLLFNLIIITSCGVNSPVSNSKQSSMPNNQNTSINAYKGEVHKNILTSNINMRLLSPTNPDNITQKQKDILHIINRI